MQTFRALFEQMRCDPAFKALYQKECHVCPFTVRIFEKIGDDNPLYMAKLSEMLGVPLKAIGELKDADYCDPHLVIRLCRHLQLDAPTACPRMPHPPASGKP